MTLVFAFVSNVRRGKKQTWALEPPPDGSVSLYYKIVLRKYCTAYIMFKI